MTDGSRAAALGAARRMPLRGGFRCAPDACRMRGPARQRGK
ncbi:hypothetical protein DP59_5854 [Burkholderia pseudomallei]|nr:hypothetical protein DP59_5854 [Burkholderia pseudomallei]